MLRQLLYAGKHAQALADEGKLVLDGLEAERKLLAQVHAANLL